MLFSVKVKVAVVGLVVAGGAAAALALGPAGLAVGQSSQPVQLQVAVNSPATLVARGAGVDVSVTITCSGPSATSGNVSINLTENVGANVATGSTAGNSAAFDCTGRAQNVEVLDIANLGGKAFVQGSAVAQVTVSACEVNAGTVGACTSTGPQATIKVRN